MFNGIDVSHHNGLIDWKAARTVLDFAIIRCGYGNDSGRQDDIRWPANYIEAQSRGLPCGVYLYSYARTLEEAESEARHVVRCLHEANAGMPDLGIWFDAEESNTAHFTVQAFKRFRSVIMSELGLPVGYYASISWLNSYAPQIIDEGYPIWLARYNASLGETFYFVGENAGKYDIWQYTSSGSCFGVAGRVDCNRMQRQAVRAVGDVWDGCYSIKEERQRKLANAMYDPAAVQREVNRYYAAAQDCIAGRYGNGPERIAALRAAGFYPGLVQRVINHIVEG